MKNRIMFIMQLPPPLHGASIVNQFIAESETIKKDYKTVVLPLRFVSNLEEIGKFSLKKLLLTIPFTFRLITRLITFRPAIVYFTIAPKGFAFYRDAFFVLFIKLFRRKIAYHLHSRGIQRSIEQNRFKRLIYRLVFKNTTAIVLSEQLSEEFTGLGLKEILILPNGIPEHIYELEKRNEEPPIILFLSNLFRSKGIFVFVQVLKILKQRGQLFQARIVGKEGDMSLNELNQLLEKEGLHQLVSVKGPLYGEEKYNALQGSSIYVHPSLDEAFPLTVLEAMQASLPVVASAVGAIPEMITAGESGFICPSGDEEAFAEKISVLLNNQQLRNNMGREARLQYEQKYTLEQFDSNLKKIIDHLMISS